MDEARHALIPLPMAALLGSTVGAAGLARIGVALVTVAAVVALAHARVIDGTGATEAEAPAHEVTAAPESGRAAGPTA